MKGFKKNGKFRPTEKKKGKVSSNQIRKKETVGVKEINSILRTKESNKKIADKIKVTFTEKDVVSSEHGNATKYSAKVTFNGKSQSFDFTDSINNHNHGIEPKGDDVLYSLALDYSAPEFEDDFYDEYGYDVDAREGSRVFKAVQKEKAKMDKLFTKKNIEDLQDDFQDY